MPGDATEKLMWGAGEKVISGSESATGANILKSRQSEKQNSDAYYSPLRRLKQQDCEFQASPGYTGRDGFTNDLD